MNTVTLDEIRKAEYDRQRTALGTSTERNVTGFILGIHDGAIAETSILSEAEAAWAISSATFGSAIKLFVAYAPNAQFLSVRDVIAHLRPALEFYAEQAVAAAKEAAKAAETPKN